MPTISLSAGSISYREDGEGPPIVLVHGLLTNGRIWRKVVPHLREHGRVIVPDLPLGSHEVAMNADADLSTRGLARMIAELLERLELTDVTLVGVDTGGALCQVVAADHPERLGRLVLTSCDMFDNFPPKLFRPLMMAARLPGALRATAISLQPKPTWRLPIAYGWLAKRPIDDDVMRSWVKPGLRADIRRDAKKVLLGIDPQETIRAAEKLRTFDKPVLLAWAADDRFFPLEQAQRFAAQVPTARLDPIPDSYTFTPEDQPEALAERIATFVREGAREGARA